MTLKRHFLITDAGLGFFRDAQRALNFATLLRAEKVRLTATDPPDFELQISGEIRAFEVTEADIPGRKRGDEYKEKRRLRTSGGPVVRHLTAEEMPSSQVVASILKRAAERKTDDRYLPEWGFLIYLNVWNFGAERNEVEAVMHEATTVVKDRFSTVWILWQDAAYRIWDNGQPCNLIIEQVDE